MDTKALPRDQICTRKLECRAMQTTPSKENQNMQNLVTSNECKLRLKLATEVARTVLSGRSFHIGTTRLEKKMCITIVHRPKLEQLALITTRSIHSGQNKGIYTACIGQSIENFKTHNEVSFDPPTLEAIEI
jgi:hypothetical protein